MADESNEGAWYWLKPDRQQMQGSLDELRGLLAARALPRSTLVWFDPWPEWRAATRVPELASALPPSTGRSRGSSAAPRPASVESAPRPTPAASTTHPAPASGSAAPTADSKGSPEPKGSTDSKPAEPKPAVSSDSGERAEAKASKPAVAPDSQKAEPSPPASGSPLPEVARPPSDRFGTFDNIVIRRATTTSDAPLEVAVPSSGPSAEAPAKASSGVRAALVLTSLGCVALALGLGFSLRALASRRAEPAPAARPVLAPAQPPGCALLTTSSKLAPSFEREVQPDMIALSGDRVAIGFAAREKEAAGVVVDLSSLDSRSAFAEASERGVVAVTPTADSPLSFAVERDDGVLASAVALDTAPRRLIGLSSQGIVARAGTEEAAPLWSSGKRPITTPRVAHLTPAGFALSFRAGGVQGEILVGWLDADGRSQGEPEAVQASAQFVGTPAIASGPSGALVAFAARNNDSEPWRLKLVRVSDERRLGQPVDFALPAEDLGAGAIAPALAAAADNRWLLQWTQGSPGKARVRVQELGPDLAPLGAPTVVSPMGANAGQGSLWALGDKTLSLFVLPVPGRDELWGAVLKCR